MDRSYPAKLKGTYRISSLLCAALAVTTLGAATPATAATKYAFAYTGSVQTWTYSGTVTARIQPPRG